MNLLLKDGTLKFGAGGEVLRSTGSGCVDCARGISAAISAAVLIVDGDDMFNDRRFVELLTLGLAVPSKDAATTPPLGGELGPLALGMDE